MELLLKTDIIGSSLDELAEELLLEDEPIFIDSLYACLFGDRPLSNKIVEEIFDGCCEYLESQGIQILYNEEDYDDYLEDAEEILLDSSSSPKPEDFED